MDINIIDVKQEFMENGKLVIEDQTKTELTAHFDNGDVTRDILTGEIIDNKPIDVSSRKTTYIKIDAATGEVIEGWEIAR